MKLPTINQPCPLDSAVLDAGQQYHTNEFKRSLRIAESEYQFLREDGLTTHQFGSQQLIHGGEALQFLRSRSYAAVERLSDTCSKNRVSFRAGCFANVVVIDIDKRWPEVQAVVDDAVAQHALDVGMRSYAAEFPGLGGEWKRNRGPWFHSKCDAWAQQALEEFEKSDLYAEVRGWNADDDLTEAQWARFNELESLFYPTPDSPDWYRCWGGCHWLAPWCARIGQLLMPGLAWSVLKGEEHSTALGVDKNIVIMDILWGDMPGEKILEAFALNYRGLSIEDAIEELNTSMCCHRVDAWLDAHSATGKDGEEGCEEAETEGKPVLRLLMDAREAAAALCVSVSTIRQLTASAQLPCVRIGRAVRYRPIDVMQFADSRRVPRIAA